MQEGIPQSLTIAEVPKRPGVINCASYAQGVRVANVVIADISEELKHEDRFVWVGLFEPDEKLLREIQEEFCLHDLAIEDAHDAHQRPKLEQYRELSLCRAAHSAPGRRIGACRVWRDACFRRAAFCRFCPTWLSAIPCRFARTLRGFTTASRQRSRVCPLRLDGFCSRPVFPHPRGIGRKGG